MPETTLRLSKSTDSEIETIKYEARQRGGRKLYKKEIVEYAIKQIRTCAVCKEKFLKWAGIKDKNGT
jgi:hypothetical protein